MNHLKRVALVGCLAFLGSSVTNADPVDVDMVISVGDEVVKPFIGSMEQLLIIQPGCKVFIKRWPSQKVRMECMQRSLGVIDEMARVALEKNPNEQALVSDLQSVLKKLVISVCEHAKGLNAYAKMQGFGRDTLTSDALLAEVVTDTEAFVAALKTALEESVAAIKKHRPSYDAQQLELLAQEVGDAIAAAFLSGLVPDLSQLPSFSFEQIEALITGMYAHVFAGSSQDDLVAIVGATDDLDFSEASSSVYEVFEEEDGSVYLFGIGRYFPATNTLKTLLPVVINDRCVEPNRYKMVVTYDEKGNAVGVEVPASLNVASPSSEETWADLNRAVYKPARPQTIMVYAL